MPSLKEHAKAFYATLDAQDWIRLRNLVTPDLTVQLGSAPPISLGAWEASLRMFYTGFPDGHHRIDDSIADGGSVVTRCWFEGTHRGAFAAVAPSGAKISVGVIHIDRYRDDKVAEQFGQLDMHGLLRQITGAADEDSPQNSVP